MPFLILFMFIYQTMIGQRTGIVYWGYSSVVKHLTADQEVLSSNLGAPCFDYIEKNVSLGM